jgi:hypothetical protein
MSERSRSSSPFGTELPADTASPHAEGFAKRHSPIYRARHAG